MLKNFIVGLIALAPAFADTINFSLAGTSTMSATAGNPLTGNSGVQTVASGSSAGSVRNTAGTVNTQGTFTFSTAGRVGGFVGGNQLFQDGGWWMIRGQVFDGATLISTGTVQNCGPNVAQTNVLACGTFITDPLNPSARPNIQFLGGSNTLRSSINVTYIDHTTLLFLGSNFLIPQTLSMNLSRTGTFNPTTGVYGNGGNPPQTNGTLSFNAVVPEPSTISMLSLTGLGALLAFRRRRQ